MAHPTMLYRFRIDLSDVDRGVYDALDFRVAMHPSEALPFLLTRVLAYALSVEDGLEFSPGGLSDPDAPGLKADGGNGGVRLWIEIGNPSARKLHKASKASQQVKVFTYKDPEALLREIESNNVHRVEQIEIYSFDSKFLERLGETLERDNRWTMIHTDGSLTISVGARSESGEVRRHSVQGRGK